MVSLNGGVGEFGVYGLFGLCGEFLELVEGDMGKRKAPSHVIILTI